MTNVAVVVKARDGSNEPAVGVRVSRSRRTLHVIFRGKARTFKRKTKHIEFMKRDVERRGEDGVHRFFHKVFGMAMVRHGDWCRFLGVTPGLYDRGVDRRERGAQDESRGCDDLYAN